MIDFSGDSAPVSPSTDTESNPMNYVHDAMDDDSGDLSHHSFEDESDSEIHEIDDIGILSNSDDEVKSHLSNDSEMADEDWQEDSTWFENDIENNEFENHSVLDSEEEEDEEVFNFTYDNLCESDDNDSQRLT